MIVIGRRRYVNSGVRAAGAGPYCDIAARGGFPSAWGRIMI
jgi:hypothetical protein